METVLTKSSAPKRQALFWFLALTVTVGVIYLLRDIMLPFVAALAIAYLLDPVADRLERFGFSRSVSAGLIIGGVFTALVIGIVLLVPVAVTQINTLIHALPNLAERTRQLLLVAAGQLGIDGELMPGMPDLAATLKEYSASALTMLRQLVISLLGGGAALLNIASLLVVTPVIAFYLLVDWDRLVAKVDTWLPRDYAPLVRARFREIDNVLSEFVRGQATICGLLALYYAIGLSLAGLPSGFIIGLVTGTIAFIPFVGAGVAGVLSIGLALFTWWPDLTRISIVAAVYLFGQVLEGKVLTPKLMGARVGLHPVWVLFGLFAGGAVMGFTGMLIAVPLFAVLGVLARFALQQYLESPYYLGREDRSAGRSRGDEG